MNPFFQNVNPTPFQPAQLPFGILGRSVSPTLPAIGGYSAADLERMRFQLMQSGADPAMLGRVQEVMSMRGMEAGPADPELQLLRPTPTKVGRAKQVGHDAAAARQALIQALATRPQ